MKKFIALVITETGIRQVSEEALNIFGVNPNAAYCVMRSNEAVSTYDESVLEYKGEALQGRIQTLKDWVLGLELEVGDRISTIQPPYQFSILYLGESDDELENSVSEREEEVHEEAN